MDFLFDPSLVLYLPLYELDGSSFMSRDACGHNCTVTGAVWRSISRYFDGTDDEINCGNNTIFDITGTFTIEAWVKATSAQAGSIAAMMLKANAWGLCYDHSTADYRGVLLLYSGASPYHGGGPMAVSEGVWHHWCGIYDGTYMLTYLDGELGASRNVGALALDTNTNNVYLGSGGGAEWFGGNVGEVRIYSRHLTPLEVQHNYLATKWRYQ